MRILFSAGDLNTPDLLPGCIQLNVNWVDPWVMRRHSIAHVDRYSTLLKGSQNSIICSVVNWIQLKVFPQTSMLRMRNRKTNRVGLPWWRGGWESACQCRGHGFEPWSRKIPHAAEQLGPWATITEPARLEPVLDNKRGRDSERPAHRDEEWPPLAASRKSPRTEAKTQCSQKLK